MGKKIKSLSVYRITANPELPGNQTPDSEELIVSQSFYHEQFEKPVQEIQFNTEGNPEHTVLYEYDAQGFLIREQMLEGDGTLISKKTFEADQKGRLLKEFGHYADGSMDTTSYEYDPEGHLICRIALDEEGQEEWRETFEFVDGQPVREALVGGDGFLVKEKLMEYDEDGLLDEMIVRDLIEGVEVRKEYEYDDNGLRTGFITYDENDQPVERVLLSYDEKGRPTQVVDENKQRKNTTHMVYNDQGQVVKQEEFDMHGNLLYSVVRTYDPQGQVLDSHVFIYSPVPGAGQRYTIRNQYEFFDSESATGQA